MLIRLSPSELLEKTYSRILGGGVNRSGIENALVLVGLYYRLLQVNKSPFICPMEEPVSYLIIGKIYSTEFPTRSGVLWQFHKLASSSFYRQLTQHQQN